MLPVTKQYVTANSQSGFISLDGRSEKSQYWAGGASYMVMCLKCGLEPSRPGVLSNCFCMCDICSAPLNGHGSMLRGSSKAAIVCKQCGGEGNAVIPICTREVRKKRSHESYLAWPKKKSAEQSSSLNSSAAVTVAATLTGSEGGMLVAVAQVSAESAGSAGD